MNNSAALALAGESITAASNNQSTNLRKRYLEEATSALDSIDPKSLAPSQKGIYSMLQQKLLGQNPISYPQFSGLDAIPLVGKSKIKLGLAATALGSTIILLLGQPTLFQLFSNSLEVQLWDRSEVVTNNAIAIAAVAAVLIVWRKLDAIW